MERVYAEEIGLTSLLLPWRVVFLASWLLCLASEFDFCPQIRVSF